MVKDFTDGAVKYGPTKFSIILYKYNIVSLSTLILVERLSEYLPPTNVSAILVEILANDIKDDLIFKKFFHVLENVSTLRYLYHKIRVIGWYIINYCFFKSYFYIHFIIIDFCTGDVILNNDL